MKRRTHKEDLQQKDHLGTGSRKTIYLGLKPVLHARNFTRISIIYPNSTAIHKERIQKHIGHPWKKITTILAPQHRLLQRQLKIPTSVAYCTLLMKLHSKTQIITRLQCNKVEVPLAIWKQSKRPPQENLPLITLRLGNKVTVPSATISWP